MTHMLIHELPEQSKSLIHRLRCVLQEAPGSVAAELLDRAKVEAAAKPRMVVTGQYSSGKSSLIKALTDGAVNPLIDADIATSEVTEYDWDGAVTLVDTPGVQSGRRGHDEIASEAIGNADFILFVTTVALFDDAARDYLRYLANELQMFGQMILVIAQTSKAPPAKGVREQEVQEALGTVDINLPIVEVDSVYYMRSLEGGARADSLRVLSRIDELRAAINQLSEDRGSLARLRQPLTLVRQLCDAAQELFVADDHSRVALSLLASQARTISERHSALDTAFSGAETEFKRHCLADVVGFVDTVTTLPDDGDGSWAKIDAAEASLVEALERHAERFAGAIKLLAGTQFNTLNDELVEIGDSNRLTRLLQSPIDLKLEAPDSVHAESAVRARPGFGAAGVDWRRMAELIKRGQGWWGAGDGVRDAAGSLGHKLVLEVGHKFSFKFKPWQAVKIADKIGKFAKLGGFILQAGSAGYEVWQNEREARAAQISSERQHAALVTEIMGQADKIAAGARHQLASIIDPQLDALLAEIRNAQNEILSADVMRGAAATELREIAAEADRLLHESAVWRGEHSNRALSS